MGINYVLGFVNWKVGPVSPIPLGLGQSSTPAAVSANCRAGAGGTIDGISLENSRPPAWWNLISSVKDSVSKNR